MNPCFYLYFWLYDKYLNYYYSMIYVFYSFIFYLLKIEKIYNPFIFAKD